MDKKRSTRASSDVATRRSTRKSPGRKRSPSPMAEDEPHIIGNISPTQPKRRARPKSASRKEPNEATKITKSPRKAATASKKSPTKLPSVRLDRLNVDNLKKSESTSSSVVTTKTITLTSSMNNKLSKESKLKRSPSHRSVTRSMSRSVFGDREFSDNEEELSQGRIPSSIYETRHGSIQRQDQVIRYGGLSAMLILLTVPAVTISIVWMSCGPKGSWTWIYENIDKWLHWQASLVYILFTLVVSIASIIPAGRIVEIPRDDDYKQYNFNGFATAILLFLFVVCCEFRPTPISALQFIYENYITFFLTAIVMSLLVSLAAYWRAKYWSNSMWNPYAKSGKPLCDFFMGREVCPRWFNMIDAKLAFYRLAIITALLMNVSILVKCTHIPQTPTLTWPPSVANITAYVSSIPADVGTVSAASMLILYCMDLLIFEHHLTSSFDIQYEGFGAHLLLRYATFPFLASTLPMYLSSLQARSWCPYMLIASTVIFLAGLVVKRCSDKVKYGYRMDAGDPKHDDLETISTFQGQGIIVGSLWGIVRHPNYIGEILIFAAFLPMLYLRFAWGPLAAILYIQSCMICRASRVDKRCSMKYHSAWDKYMKRVPSLLLPRVY